MGVTEDVAVNGRTLAVEGEEKVILEIHASTIRKLLGIEYGVVNLADTRIAFEDVQR